LDQEHTLSPERLEKELVAVWQDSEQGRHAERPGRRRTFLVLLAVIVVPILILYSDPGDGAGYSSPGTDIGHVYRVGFGWLCLCVFAAGMNWSRRHHRAEFLSLVRRWATTHHVSDDDISLQFRGLIGETDAERFTPGLSPDTGCTAFVGGQGISQRPFLLPAAMAFCATIAMVLLIIHARSGHPLLTLPAWRSWDTDMWIAYLFEGCAIVLFLWELRSYRRFQPFYLDAIRLFGEES
jgi:hypothetical protein